MAAAEELEQFMENDEDGNTKTLKVPEGAFKGWVPRVLYSYSLDTLHLPFLRLLSFPVGGTALGNLTSMKTFHAVGNYLCRLPACFVECRLIVSLDLSFNYFTEIPHPVFSLVNLQELNFAYNDIEHVGEDIGQLVNLRFLNLGGNTLQSLPENIAICEKIQKLDLSGKFYPRGKMKDFPQGVCSLVDLTELDLSWQQIEKIPDEFGNLVCLEKLNLKGNRLVHVSSEMRMCVKLQSVNLAGALRLCSQIPAALFSLEDLQSLNLSDNFFTEIPEEVLGLGHLTTLNMQRNALLRLPDNLFQLQNLSHLELSENYLETLPAAVGSLSSLIHLGLDRNRLTEIPDELCQVTSLVSLAVSSNQLSSIPEKIHHLSKLQFLSLENNKLKELPLLLDRLEGLVETDGLSLHGNDLRSPPQAICDQGIGPLFHFLRELRVSEATHRRKMILIGAVKAGKTSLRNALMLGRSKLTEEHERTWVLERHLWEPESKLRVQILDLGGHHIYQAAHHMFLTPEALHLLVFDLSCYSAALFDEFISHWLDAIMDRAPGATILLVGTHSDLCTEEEVADKSRNVIDRIQKEETAKLKELQDEIDRCRVLLEQPERKEEGGGTFGDLGVERLQEKLSYLERMQNNRCKVPDMVYVVSCAEGLAGVEDLKQELVTIVRTYEDLVLPESWYKFLLEIQDESAPILSMEQARNIFVSVMASVKQSLMSIGVSADRSISMVLKYLHATGEIIWFHDNPRLNTIIFHRPETLIEMLRAVFRHDFERVVQFDQVVGNKVGLSASRFEILKEDFVRRGVMTYEMLHFTLLHFHLSSDALDIFVSLMLKFDLCYEVTSDNDPSRVGSAHILQFPWFFAKESPPNLLKIWPAEIPPNTFELRFQVTFPRSGPPYFFEKLSVRLQQHVSERQNWKHGILARLNHSLLLVTRKCHVAGNCTIISVCARGSTDLQELWFLLKETRKEMLQLLQDWPFIQPAFSLICSHCLLRHYPSPFSYPGEVMGMAIPRGIYVARWCRKYEEETVPVCFVYPLDKDYQDDIQKHMQAATDFLQSTQDSTDGPPGLLSDAGLAFLATRLGFQWTNLMALLGVTSVTMEQKQMSYPNNAYMQILETLRHWSRMPPQGDGDTHDMKVRQLLKALVADGIENFELAEEIQNRFHLQTDE
ncbi:malignant fibrous histiocytoma-amplified sequence 1 homolog [Babylonia areolata]|uniref:malignant fibrous histiocytoma-amplified sequence 1 homolog n=1 Tax=Babylonia areolata TaxID=304850 RepID=UPI003FD5C5D7